VPSSSNESRSWLRRPLSRRGRVFAEAFLWAIAVSSFGGALAGYCEAAHYQAVQKARFAALLVVPSKAFAQKPTAVHAEPSANPGAVIGLLEIPRLHLSTIVREGDDDTTLLEAIGHIPGTALPGSPGNVGLAGHRDTFFRALGSLKPGDLIALQTLNGTYQYRVKSRSIVEPSDVAVLASTGKPALTLVTCFPFHYIGAAPERFVVAAVQDASPIEEAKEQTE
jgi:sortase A